MQLSPIADLTCHLFSHPRCVHMLVYGVLGGRQGLLTWPWAQVLPRASECLAWGGCQYCCK
jgi:hypothetical protein